MEKNKAALIVWILVCVFAVIQGLYYYPQLPQKVASHYALSGRPDGWSGKQVFMQVYVIVVLLFAALFSILPYLTTLLPTSWINLPNKDHWMSGKHRPATLTFLRFYPLWFASATMLLVIDIFRQAFTANIDGGRSLSHPSWSIAVYCVFSLLWAVGFLLKFRSPK